MSVCVVSVLVQKNHTLVKDKALCCNLHYNCFFSFPSKYRGTWSCPPLKFILGLCQISMWKKRKRKFSIVVETNKNCKCWPAEASGKHQCHFSTGFQKHIFSSSSFSHHQSCWNLQTAFTFNHCVENVILYDFHCKTSKCKVRDTCFSSED